jgi:catechol 2,3-dioxygenase-like lactoylglutathione lyase family enzyme
LLTNRNAYTHGVFHLTRKKLKQKQMKQKIALISLLVGDYDEAIDFYTRRLNFILLEDTKLSETKRWVRIAPPGSTETCLLLAKAEGADQKSRIGNQTGGRVFLFLYTDNFSRDYQNLLDQKVTIVRKPVTEAYGTVAVFADLYGNLWDMIEPA